MMLISVSSALTTISFSSSRAFDCLLNRRLLRALSVVGDRREADDAPRDGVVGLAVAQELAAGRARAGAVALEHLEHRVHAREAADVALVLLGGDVAEEALGVGAGGALEGGAVLLLALAAEDGVGG